MTRTELLAQKYTGLTQDVSAATQRLFDNGHATEAMFRPVAESMIGDDLYPITGSIEFHNEHGNLKLLASFDGMTLDYSVGYEHKLYSQANVDAIEQTGEPPIYHCWQMEQQLLVSGAVEILFATSDGTESQSRVCRYKSKPERRAALIAGWKQFAKDLAAYVPPVAEAPKPTGKAPETLPALQIEVTGAVKASNLAAFKETALTAIRGVNRKLETDQDFADAEQSVKWCEEVESRLKAAKEHALSQTTSIDQLFKTIDDISAEAAKVRIELGKLVKARKETIKGDIVAGGVAALAKHIQQINASMPGAYMPQVHADFGGCIKNLRTVDSIRNAVDTELAKAKVAASEIANRIQVNIKALKTEADDWGFLFPDLAQVANKSAEDFANLVAARVAKYQQDQEDARRRAVKLEEERLEREAAAAAQAAQVLQQAAAPVVAAPAPVVAQRAPVASDTTIKLGDINARLAPVTLTADGLAQLGFVHVATDKSAKLYRESDFQDICAALVKHINASALAVA
jgi:predicted phage-related endonuclease